MIFHLINFIEKINSTNFDQLQENVQNNSSTRAARCSNCDTLVNPSIYFTFVEEDIPNTPSLFSSQPHNIYMCPNSNCPSVVALDGQKKLFDLACDLMLIEKNKKATNTAIALPEQPNTTALQSSNLASVSSFSTSNLSSNQVTDSVVNNKELMENVADDSLISPVNDDEDDTIDD